VPKEHLAKTITNCRALQRRSNARFQGRALRRIIDRDAPPGGENIHNVLPPHREGKDDPDRVHKFQDPCHAIDGRKVCYTTDRLGTRIHVTAQTPDGTRLIADPPIR